MFGTMGFSELIIILVIVLIIFGAGKLPQIGEGLGKALKGFKKEVHEAPQLSEPTPGQEGVGEGSVQTVATAQGGAAPSAPPAPQVAAPVAAKPNAPYQPGPELTPGTTASLMYAAGPQPYQPQGSRQPGAGSPPQAAPSAEASPTPPSASAVPPPPSMEDRMASAAAAARPSYPALPPEARPKPGAKRPSAVVNKEAVARVQAQQAARRQQGTAQQKGGLSPNDMQSLGEGLGDALRTFRQAASDVRGAVEPELRTLQSEMDAAQKDIEQTVESAKEMPPSDDQPRST